MKIISRNTKSMFWTPATETEIKEIVLNLPNKKSSGFEKLDNILLKELCPELVPSLCILFNRSLQEGIFPDCMKLAEVVPLYKGKDRCQSTNY